MGKFGYAGYMIVFLIVTALHLLLLRSTVERMPVVAQPKAEICRITLSHAALQKPPPPVIPSAPQVAPVQPPAPRAKPPEPVPKPKKKRVRHIQKVLPKTPLSQKKSAPAPKPLPSRQTAPEKQIDTATLKAHYIALVRQKIGENLYYPKLAKRMRIQGEVDVAFVVLGSGEVTGVRILRAPREVLARGAARTIGNLKLPPVPKALGPQLELSIPIEFKLQKGSR